MPVYPPTATMLRQHGQRSTTLVRTDTSMLTARDGVAEIKETPNAQAVRAINYRMIVGRPE